ncbi:hypothetical protein Tco_1319392 [Tanacetum coccineum]
MARRPLGWKVVEHVSHKKFSNRGVIIVEDDPDVIHVDKSYDLVLSTSLNDLEIAALHIDGQPIDVDAASDIIDVVDENNDIINEKDPIPHDLADSDDEDLVNLDIDDGVNVMSADVARGHGGDGGGDDRPPPYQVPTGCGGCLGNRGKGTRKPNLGGRRSGQAAYPPGDPIPRVKASRIRKRSGPVPIRFLRLTTEETLMPLGDHLRSLGKYSKSLVRECLALPFFRQIRRSGRRGSVGKEWCKPSLTCVPTWNPTAGHKSMRASIPPQNLQKIYNGKKAALKERYWVPEEDGTYDLERLRRGRPTHISEWRPQLQRDEMLRLQGLGSNTPTGVPYTEDEIMAIVSQLGGASSRGHIPGGWTGFASTGTMLNQLESQPEYGGGSGSGGCGDDEPGDDEDDGEDEDDS